MEDKQLTTEQSLELIARMIAQTRRNFNDRGGAMFLIWGYTTVVVTLAIMAAFLLTRSHDVMWGWCALPLVGGALMWRHFSRHQRPVATHLDKAMAAVWTVLTGAVACCMAASFTSALIAGRSYINVLFTIGLMISIGTAITGKMINYRPVQFGGVVGMGLSFALLPLTDTIWQFPMFAAIFLFGQVIPGHLLNSACKREAKKGRAA
jgi:hypothetical protein